MGWGGRTLDTDMDVVLGLLFGAAVFIRFGERVCECSSVAVLVLGKCTPIRVAAAPLLKIVRPTQPQ